MARQLRQSLKAAQRLTWLRDHFVCDESEFGVHTLEHEREVVFCCVESDFRHGLQLL